MDNEVEVLRRKAEDYAQLAAVAQDHQLRGFLLELEREYRAEAERLLQGKVAAD